MSDSLFPQLRVHDFPVGLGSGKPVDTACKVVKCSIHRRLSAPEEVSYESVGSDALALSPGTSPPGTRIIDIMLDQDTVDARMLSMGAEVLDEMPPVVQESGASIALAHTTSRIARQTAQQITVKDAITGVLGKVHTLDTAGTITPKGLLPLYVGLAHLPVCLSYGPTGNPVKATAQENALALAYRVDTSVAGLPVDVDINKVDHFTALQAITERFGSLVDPQRAQFVVCTGDTGVMGAMEQRGPGRSVYIGALGDNDHPVTTFVDFDPDDHGSTGQPILTGSSFQSQSMQQCAAVDFTGGDTQHGLPLSGNITGLVTINHALADAVGNVQSGMPVISFYGDRNNGGIYYSPGDEALHPWPGCPSMGVNCLWYDQGFKPGQGLIYAGTDTGVFQTPSDVTHPKPFKRLGGMALKVLKVQMAQSHLYALVEVPGTGTRYVLFYVGAATSDRGKKYDVKSELGWGWDEWLHVGGPDSSLADFAVTADQGAHHMYLYMLTGSNPAQVSMKRLFPLETGNPTIFDNTDFGTTGASPVGIDPACTCIGKNKSDVVEGVWIRTDSGAGNLYFSVAGHKPIQANPPNLPNFKYGTLVDAEGAPVMVNRVVAHPAGLFKWDGCTPRTVRALAVTNRGLYVGDSYTGDWHRTDGQSNLGDIALNFVASAPPCAWLGRMLTRLYAAGDRSFYVSHDGSLHWVSVLEEQLSAAPAYFSLWAETKGGTHYPPKELAHGDAGSYPTNTSRGLAYTTGTKQRRGDYVLVRDLDGIGRYSYLMVNPHSTAPAGTTRCASISQISLPAQIAEVDASRLVTEAEARFLGFTDKPQEVGNVLSRFSNPKDPLRFLQPGESVRVRGTITHTLFSAGGVEYTDYLVADDVYKVLEHTMTYDASNDPNSVLTSTRLGRYLLDDRSSPDKLEADAWYNFSRALLYKRAGPR